MKSFLFNSTVLVEPTNICNLKCIMCEAKCTTDKGVKAEYLKPEELDIMLGKLDGYISNVVFQGDCEPTLNPYLGELVKVAKKYTEHVSIVTNGLALTSKKIDELIECGVSWFAISIDSHVPEVYNNIRRNSNFEKLMENLDYLLKLKNTVYKNIKIVTHKIVFNNDSEEYLKDYIRYFYVNKGVDKVTFAPLVEEGSIENKNWIITRNNIENDLIKEGINLSLKDFSNYPYMSINKYCGTNLFFLGHTGSFAPCGLHTKENKVFGNLLTESLEEIVNKDVFKEFHNYWLNNNFNNKVPHICENCYLLRSPYFSYCIDVPYEKKEEIDSCNLIGVL